MKTENGFTIIELVIVIIIGSFVWLALIKGYSNYLDRKALEDTRIFLDRIEAGLSSFVRTNGRYPCPADPTLGPGDLNYGLEAAGCGAVGFDSAVSMTWFGHPIASDRDADGDGDATNDFILFGSVPFRTIEPCIDNPLLDCNLLPLEETYTIDAWGNKFTYAVTQDLTRSGSFNNNFGAIGVEDEFRRTVIEPADTAHYALISHGPNQYGAFNREGSQIQDECTPSRYMGPPLPPPPVTPFHNERENCDFDDPLIVSALKNTAGEYFDDIVVFNKSAISSLWRSVGLSQMVNNNNGFVGVGDFTPGDEPETELHVRGDLQALDILTDRLCDEDGNTCFVPEFLGGPEDTTSGGTGATDPTDFQNACSNPNEAVIEIRENQVICSDVYSTGVVASSCPTGEVMVGYSNVTGIVCAPL